MIASKVTVNSELLNAKLTQERKRELQKQAIKDYILQRSYMERIIIDEFKSVIGAKAKQTAGNLVEQMIADGEIVRHELGIRAFAYTVETPIKVVKEADKPLTPPSSEKIVAHQMVMVAGLAKDFYWQSGSNDLHEFVKWLEHRDDES